MEMHLTPCFDSSMPDEEMIKLFLGGDDSAFSALIERYIGLIRAIAAKYRVPGLETDDLTQEGLLCFLEAAKNYRSEKGASFKTYAGICVDRGMATLLRQSAAYKRKALNNYVSIDAESFREVSGGVDPENMYIGKESLSDLHAVIPTLLSDMEQRVLKRYLSGESYDDIAAALGTNRKSVDNAMVRVRKKLRDHLSSISSEAL